MMIDRTERVTLFDEDGARSGKRRICEVQVMKDPEIGDVMVFISHGDGQFGIHAMSINLLREVLAEVDARQQEAGDE